MTLTCWPAEFRGPGARNSFDHEDDDYDMDIRRERPGYGGRNGRVILLGDGTEVLTDSTDDSEMFDHSMEDDDDDKPRRGGSSATSEHDSTRGEREGTPGPGSSVEDQHNKHESVSQGPGTQIKAVADTPGGK